MGRSVEYSEFLALFEQCNRALWPLQVVGYLAMLIVLACMITSWRHAQRAIFGILGPFWIFVGVVFQYAYLRPLYRPGRVFAVLWVTEGVLLIFSASRLSGPFGRHTGWCAILGWLAISYSLIGYPVLGFLLRGSALRVAWPGVFPCPTALFTLAVLVMAQRPAPKWLMAVPAFWAVGGVVPFSWGILEDLGLVVLGILIIATIVHRDRRPQCAVDGAPSLS
jgi:hypothetical protein